MSEPETLQLSDSAAVIYEQEFVPAIFDQWPPRLAEAAAIEAGSRVLDVGCGTGILAREAALRVGPAGRVTGFDVNQSMLDVAQRIRPELEWRQGEAGALPFEDGAFDAVVSQFALMFFPDQVAALREMWRVLAPGGGLAVAVWTPLERVTGYAALTDILRTRVGEEAAVATAAAYELGDEVALMGLFESAGIADAALETHDGWGRFASIDEFIRIEIKGWVLADSLDEAGYRALLEEGRDRLASFCDESGKFATPMDAHIVSARKT